ncbi:hypothetical protein D9C73_018689 [Collichthys lucidus]|uniref:Uncharacterized protein n=1 Tax=Collichthys lucidus TaxID=240159 RepID=A0A4U5V978_COLLU|nr:hypothetical protein D9C73_018689 [Collichthys lucidus]
MWNLQRKKKQFLSMVRNEKKMHTNNYILCIKTEAHQYKFLDFFHADELSDLQKIDQMEFEAAQKNEATQMNVTEEQNDGSRYLEASQDGSVEERVEGVDISTAEGGGNSDSATREGSESGSSEEADEHHEAKPESMSSVDESHQDSTKEQDVLE